MGLQIDNKLSWEPHLLTQGDKCLEQMRMLASKLRSFHSPKPRLIRWVFTGIIRPKFIYGALIFGHQLHKSSRVKEMTNKLNRVAAMCVTKITRSTPQAALGLILDIIPLDLHIKKEGLKTFLRLNRQLNHRENQTSSGHLNYWANKAKQLNSPYVDDCCLETFKNKRTRFKCK